MLVKNATPLAESINKVKLMLGKLEERRTKENRLKQYARVVPALEELVALNLLVERQVTMLMQKLDQSAKIWKERLYSSCFYGAPTVGAADVAPDGTLCIDAVVEGNMDPAHYISNASDLRATLYALLFAFWDHLLKERGGMSLMVFDDMQELFDEPNKRRLANCLPQLVSAGAHIVATTIEASFGRFVALAVREHLGFQNLDRRRIHTLNCMRPHLFFGQFIEAIEKKRKDFEDPVHVNEAQYARGLFERLTNLP